MKKLMALALALVLCVCAAAACAETTVQEKVIEAYNLELNTKADMLILADELCKEGIAVVTVDYSYHGICAVLHDAATTGRRNNAKLGEEAARLLIRRIEREPEAAEHIRIPGIPQQDNS